MTARGMDADSSLSSFSSVTKNLNINTHRRLDRLPAHGALLHEPRVVRARDALRAEHVATWYQRSILRARHADLALRALVERHRLERAAEPRRLGLGGRGLAPEARDLGRRRLRGLGDAQAPPNRPPRGLEQTLAPRAAVARRRRLRLRRGHRLGLARGQRRRRRRQDLGERRVGEGLRVE